MCDLCTTKMKTIKLKLDCTHQFCFSCVKNKQNCPICGFKTNIDLKKVTLTSLNFIILYGDYIWLYAAYGDEWWGYEPVVNDTVEHAFIDYKHRKKIFEYQPDIALVNSPNNQLNTNKEHDKNITIPTCTTEFVNYSNKYLKKKSKHKTTIPSSYFININHQDYRLDFNLMKQVNALDVNKSRRIKRLAIDKFNTLIELITQLKTHQIKGISGVKF
jgi:hypothetical protein